MRTWHSRFAVVLALVAAAHAAARLAVAQEIVAAGSSEGLVFGRRSSAIAYDVKQALPSRSTEPWFPTLYNPPTVEIILEPPQLRPEGIAFRSGLLYVSGDWNETQNQIAVFSVNSWGEPTFSHAIQEPLSNPPPTTSPNNQWWGAEGLTFNTGASGIGAGGNTIVSVDNQQQGVGNTMAEISATGVVSDFRVVPYPEDICYAPVAQRFYLLVRSPNELQAYDINMNSLGIAWPLPSRTRGATVVSEQFGRFITGDDTIVGEVILAVSAENLSAIPPQPNRLSAYRLDGTQIGTTQDVSWINLALDNGSGGGGDPGAHTFQGIAVDEDNKTIFIADDSARAVYTLKRQLPEVGVASGPIGPRAWTARGVDVDTTLPSRSAESWFPSLAASMSDPPRLAPEGMAFLNGQLYVSGDWHETQNQIAVFDGAPDGAMTYNRSIQIPIPTPPPNPTAANNSLWGPEGLAFNTSAAGYGANAAQLVTCEDAQYLLAGNTRALVDPITGALTGFGVFSSIVGSASPDDLAYGSQTNRFYVVVDPDVLQVWNATNPPTYANSQFVLPARSKGIAVISAAFTQYLLNDPTITQEHLLIVSKSKVGSTSAPNNRLSIYTTPGVLRFQQDLLWTRDAFPGSLLQEFEAVAVDEINRVIYIGDEQAHGVFVLTPSSPVSINTASLPNGTAGVPYSQTITATGGTPPYSFSLAAGELPTNLTLSGAGSLTGEPTACNLFTFTISVQDSSLPPQTSFKQFTVGIASPGPAGDTDADGSVTGMDIRGFVNSMLQPSAALCGADMNADYVVNDLDVPAFVNVLLAP